MKDLVDLVLIPSLSAFEVERLRAALRTTFTNRGTHPLHNDAATSSGLKQRAGEWRTTWGFIPDVSTAYGRVAAFLDPVLDKTAPDDGCWDPLPGVWELNNSDHRL